VPNGRSAREIASAFVDAELKLIERPLP
jgi:hypothetical protein